MPSNSLALLAMLALGYIGLLSTRVSEFATFFAVLIEQCVALGILSFFVPLNIRNGGVLTRTPHLNPRAPNSSIQVRANRSQSFTHRCNWRCYWNFNFDNCPLLCGDRCILSRRQILNGAEATANMGEPSEREALLTILLEYAWKEVLGSYLALGCQRTYIAS
jgi:hypothetical protein